MIVWILVACLQLLHEFVISIVRKPNQSFVKVFIENRSARKEIELLSFGFGWRYAHDGSASPKVETGNEVAHGPKKYHLSPIKCDGKGISTQTQISNARYAL